MIFLANNDKTEQAFRTREKVMLGSYKNFCYGGNGANRVGACFPINQLSKGYDANFSSK